MRLDVHLCRSVAPAVCNEEQLLFSVLPEGTAVRFMLLSKLVEDKLLFPTKLKKSAYII